MDKAKYLGTCILYKKKKLYPNVDKYILNLNVSINKNPSIGNNRLLKKIC